MTIDEIIALFDARKVGKGRWVAKCPAHKDKSPSLSIKEGDKAALLTCWSHGCTVKQICMAMGIYPSSLWYAAIEKDPRKREEAARKAEEKRQFDAWYEDERRKAMRSAIAKAVIWQRVSWHLGDKLSTRLQDARLGKLFHASLDRSRHYHNIITAHEKGNRLRYDACALGSIKDVLVKDVGVAIWQYLFVEDYGDHYR